MVFLADVILAGSPWAVIYLRPPITINNTAMPPASPKPIVRSVCKVDWSAQTLGMPVASINPPADEPELHDAAAINLAPQPISYKFNYRYSDDGNAQPNQGIINSAASASGFFWVAASCYVAKAGYNHHHNGNYA